MGKINGWNGLASRTQNTGCIFYLGNFVVREVKKKKKVNNCEKRWVRGIALPMETDFPSQHVKAVAKEDTI